jgi:hypothetical protein
MKSLLVALSLLAFAVPSRADEPSDSARAERARTIQKRQERQARTAARAPQRRGSSVALRAALQANVARAAAQDASAGAAIQSSLMPRVVSGGGARPAMLQPDFIAYTRSSNGTNSATYIYPNVVLTPYGAYPPGY